MLMIKIIIYSFIFLTCSLIGILNSRKYVDRVNELKDFKEALNIFKTKVKFTYEPIPEIFNQISENSNSRIARIFKVASNNMKFYAAGDAWIKAINTDMLNINAEDKNILKSLGKLLGQTDIEGQISQIELTSTFLEEQIIKAEKEREKNEKLYRTLGTVIGMTIVIILM